MGISVQLFFSNVGPRPPVNQIVLQVCVLRLALLFQHTKKKKKDIEALGILFFFLTFCLLYAQSFLNNLLVGQEKAATFLMFA